jgi:hypothetical protein
MRFSSDEIDYGESVGGLMKEKIGFSLLFLFGFVLGLILLTNDARAQQPATGSKPAQPSASGQSGAEGPYTITSSIEFGVRGIAIDGNAGHLSKPAQLYSRISHLRFELVHAVKGQRRAAARFVDDQLVRVGKDPNRYLRVNAEKTKAYRFDANYRRFDYFNSLTNIALGQHTANTEYRQGDFNLTILPQNERVRFNLGYSLSRNSGRRYPQFALTETNIQPPTLCGRLPTSTESERTQGFRFLIYRLCRAGVSLRKTAST